MADNKAIRKWSELKGMAVAVPSEGKRVGTIVDFYFKKGTNAVHAFRVSTRVLGDFALPVQAIQSVEADAVTTDTERRLLSALPALPSGQSLRGRKIIGENGTEAGIVGDILIGVDPPVAMRIAGFELANPSKGGVRPKRFSAEAVVSYEEDAVVIDEQIARRLR
jgi:uncharacterized protein YrrD